jgi:hypothetical protein
LAAGGRAQISTDEGKAERSTNVRELIKTKVTEMTQTSDDVTNDMFGEFLPFKQTAEYEVTTNAATKAVGELKNRFKEFTAVMDSVIGVLDGGNDKGTKETVASVKKSWDDLFAAIKGNFEIPKDEDAKYTDGGLEKTKPAETWDLVSVLGKPTVSSLQRVGGGGQMESLEMPSVKDLPQRMKEYSQRMGFVQPKGEDGKLQPKKKEVKEKTEIQKQIDSLTQNTKSLNDLNQIFKLSLQSSMSRDVDQNILKAQNTSVVSPEAQEKANKALDELGKIQSEKNNATEYRGANFSGNDELINRLNQAAGSLIKSATSWEVISERMNQVEAPIN